MTKVRMGLAGTLGSLMAGSVGAYFGLRENEDIDPVTSVLNLNSSRTSGRGRCMVRTTSSTTLGQDKEYGEFLKQSGDAKASIATACLRKFPEINKEYEDVTVEVINDSYGKYIVSQVKITGSYIGSSSRG
ncbi:hypothetical protein HF1_13050 [Mycoplasma haemofelis str. Langford 1]|uniref:Uncharacterized protein n=1 Tax=Mycoplasma haemofelis (strain Langford 1) TaxID=941640 RepID=E8ZJJ2_MYCHL|nr:hypothetical protein [Mycoplasma haemofelis]CBY93313.1 hypothetical protein HF1_13050 [Mycoplasma haemofelis str. Langford 1]